MTAKWLLGVACGLVLAKFLCQLGSAPTVVPLRIRLEDLARAAREGADDDDVFPGTDARFPEDVTADLTEDLTADITGDLPDADVSFLPDVPELGDLALDKPVTPQATVQTLAIVEESWERRTDGSPVRGRLARAFRRLLRGCRRGTP